MGPPKSVRLDAILERAQRLAQHVAALADDIDHTQRRILARLLGMTEPHVLTLGQQLLAYLSVSGLFVTVALSDASRSASAMS